MASYGGSAGAGISLWLAFHDDLAKPDASDPIARQSTRLVAAGTTNGQSTYDMRTFREWFGVPNLEPHPALTDFYAVKTDADWQSERVLNLMHDASAITRLTADDVPVFMVYGNKDVPVDASTSHGVWVHHVRLGQKLKEAMTKLNLECTVTQDGRDGGLNEFLIRQLKAAK
jgi:acetyl esterase/lipase